MFTVGLTGGIASGKTAVSDAFAALGVPIVDADIVAREVVQRDSAGLAALVEHFGDDILNEDNSLDRKALRTRIFNDSAARELVNSLLHPLIRSRSDELLEKAAKEQHAYAIYVVPLLVETKQADRFNRILVVDVSRQVQLARLTARDGVDESQAIATLDAQATRSERLAIADDILTNNESLDAISEKVARLHPYYLRLSTCGN